MLNHQFPGHKGSPSDEAITAVDFPIHEYVCAWIMKLTGSKSVAVNRLYTLLWSVLGLFYLFKIGNVIIGRKSFSFLLLVFAGTSPIFVYYSAGFLPSIPSLSCAIIAIFYYLTYLDCGEKRTLYFSVLFMTLAVLVRTTYLILFLSLSLFELYRIIRFKLSLRPRIIVLSLALIAIAGYYIYNSYLKWEYGSIFLSSLLPAKNFDQAKVLLKLAYQNWHLEFFTRFHYVLFSIALAVSLFRIFVKEERLNSLQKSTFQILLIACIGYSAFLIAMIQQFPYHDYYLLDTFFLPFVLLFGILLSAMKRIKIPDYLLGIVAVGIFIGICFEVSQSQLSRYRTDFNSRTEITALNYQGADKFLDSLHISQEAKILVIDAYAPNIPLIRMNRKGYSIITTSEKHLIESLNWNFDWISIQNEFFITDVYTRYPEILNRLEKVADNGKISLCKWSEYDLNQTLEEFLEIDKGKLFLHESIGFEENEIYDPRWSNLQPLSADAYSGNNSFWLKRDATYGITYKAENLINKQAEDLSMLFSAYIKKIDSPNCKVVFELLQSDAPVFRKEVEVNKFVSNKKAWNKFEVFYNIPEINSEHFSILIYLWNPDHAEVLVDDCDLKIFESP